MSKKLGRRIALVLVPVVAVALYKVWFATCRIRSHGIEKRYLAESYGKPLIGICWHYCVLGVFAIYRNYPLTLMISASTDGDYLARMAERFGFPVVRGSSNRKGVQAAKELIRALRRGNNAALVADGSQGPAMIAQSGSILLASKSGGTIMPMVYSASRYYSFNTWDKIILPKLFSSIDVFYGDPVTIPEGTKVSELRVIRQQLEANLNSIYGKAWQLYGKSGH